jgi:ankyrin repeat protein
MKGICVAIGLLLWLEMFAAGAAPATFHSGRAPQESKQKAAKQKPQEGQPEWRQSPLISAAYDGDLQKVRSLIESGSDVNEVKGGWTAMEAAANGGHTQVMQELIKAGADAKGRDGRKAMKNAIVGGYVATVRALIAAGADVKGPAKAEFTPLAIRSGHPEMLKILYEADQ